MPSSDDLILVISDSLRSASGVPRRRQKDLPEILADVRSKLIAQYGQDYADKWSPSGKYKTQFVINEHVVEFIPRKLSLGAFRYCLLKVLFLRKLSGLNINTLVLIAKKNNSKKQLLEIAALRELAKTVFQIETEFPQLTNFKPLLPQSPSDEQIKEVVDSEFDAPILATLHTTDGLDQATDVIEGSLFLLRTIKGSGRNNSIKSKPIWMTAKNPESWATIKKVSVFKADHSGDPALIRTIEQPLKLRQGYYPMHLRMRASGEHWITVYGIHDIVLDNFHFFVDDK